MHCLLYLNRDSFVSEAETSQKVVAEASAFALGLASSKADSSASGRLSPTAAMVRWALQQGEEAVRMVLVHEQDPSKGGCPPV